MLLTHTLLALLGACSVVEGVALQNPPPSATSVEKRGYEWPESLPVHEETNSERIKRGLAPLPPKRLFDNSRRNRSGKTIRFITQFTRDQALNECVTYASEETDQASGGSGTKVFAFYVTSASGAATETYGCDLDVYTFTTEDCTYTNAAIYEPAASP